MWEQVGRLEVIYARRQVEDLDGGNGGQNPDPNDDEHENHENNVKLNSSISVQDPIGAPVACIRLLTDRHRISVTSQVVQCESEFECLMVVWEKGREKHERLLRPRLGSSDCAGKKRSLDELLDVVDVVDVSRHVRTYRQQE